MPFEQRAFPPRRIAVIGGGVSGMGAAYYLSGDHNVVLFESEKTLGGHARTVVAGRNGDQPVDTGFIVFNYPNYPNLAALFEALDVPVTQSNMSFGVSARGGRLEYGLASIDSIFARRQHLARPAFLRMIGDILKFNRQAEAAVRPGMTIAGLVEKLGLGRWFRDYYLTPFSGAIWSTPKLEILDFPAATMVRFFRNHGILDWSENHQWFTVTGGAAEYVSRLSAALQSRGVEIRLGAAIRAVRRTPFGVEVRCGAGEWEPFDDVIFATHADDTLSLLADAAPDESAALSAVRYQSNHAVLHADPSVMPRRRKVWSSWCHVESGAGPDESIDLSYWMNSLQPIPMDDPHFVTLNGQNRIRQDLIYDETVFRHPVFDTAALDAQTAIRSINGRQNTWFAGAWLRHGFHEDGLASARDVADRIAAGSKMTVAAE